MHINLCLSKSPKQTDFKWATDTAEGREAELEEIRARGDARAEELAKSQAALDEMHRSLEDKNRAVQEAEQVRQEREAEFEAMRSSGNASAEELAKSQAALDEMQRSLEDKNKAVLEADNARQTHEAELLQINHLV